jgi:hypothetical protein
MRRALIFLGSFVVTIIVIYMVYYYSNIGKYSSGLVAFASDLPGTVMGPAEQPGKNFIGSRSINDSDTFFSYPASNTSLHYDTIYNYSVLNAINDEISNEFRGHPPIGFGNAKDGERISFNYIFRRIAEDKFVPVDTGVMVNGKRIKYFLCEPGKGVILYRSEANNLAYFHVPLRDDGFIIVQEEGANHTTPEPPLKQTDTGSVLLPLLDFNIVKLWTKKEAGTFKKNAAGYAHIEDRVKLKIEPKGKPVSGEKAGYIMRPPLRISFYQKDAITKPYLELRLRDTELLLKQR